MFAVLAAANDPVCLSSAGAATERPAHSTLLSEAAARPRGAAALRAKAPPPSRTSGRMKARTPSSPQLAVVKMLLLYECAQIVF